MTTNKQVKEWLKTVSDKRLKSLAGLIWAEGVRRGWSEFWME